MLLFSNFVKQIGHKIMTKNTYFCANNKNNLFNLRFELNKSKSDLYVREHFF